MNYIINICCRPVFVNHVNLLYNRHWQLINVVQEKISSSRTNCVLNHDPMRTNYKPLGFDIENRQRDICIIIIFIYKKVYGYRPEFEPESNGTPDQLFNHWATICCKHYAKYKKCFLCFPD